MEEAAIRGRMVEQLRRIHDDADYILSNVDKLPLDIAARHVDHVYASRVLIVARMRLEADILEYTCEKPLLSQFLTSNSVSLNSVNDCNGPSSQNLKGVAPTGGSSIFGGPVSSHVPFQLVKKVPLSQGRESQPIAECSTVENGTKNLAKTNRNLLYSRQDSVSQLGPAIAVPSRMLCENNEVVQDSPHMDSSRTPEVSLTNNVPQTPLFRLPVSDPCCSEASSSVAVPNSSQAKSNPVVECPVTENSSQTTPGNVNSTAKDFFFYQQVNPTHPRSKAPSQHLKNFRNFMDENYSPITESSVPKNSTETVPMNMPRRRHTVAMSATNMNSTVISNGPVCPPHRSPLVASKNTENVQNSTDKNFSPVTEASVTKNSSQTAPKYLSSDVDDAFFDRPANRPREVPPVPSQHTESFQNSGDQNLNPLTKSSATKNSSQTAPKNMNSTVDDASFDRLASRSHRPPLVPSQHIKSIQNSADQTLNSFAKSSGTKKTSPIEFGSKNSTARDLPSFNSPCRPSLLPSQPMEIFRNSTDQDFQPIAESSDSGRSSQTTPTNTNSTDVGALSNRQNNRTPNPPGSPEHASDATNSSGRNSSLSVEFALSISPTSTVDINNALEIEGPAAAQPVNGATPPAPSHAKHSENEQEPMDIGMPPVEKSNSPGESIQGPTEETNGNGNCSNENSVVSVFTQRPGTDDQTTLQNCTAPQDLSSKCKEAFVHVERISRKTCPIWIFDKPNGGPKKQLIRLGSDETSQTKDAASQNHSKGLGDRETALLRDDLIKRLKTNLQSKFQENDTTAMDLRESSHISDKGPENEATSLENPGTSNSEGEKSTRLSCIVRIAGSKKRGRPKKMVDPLAAIAALRSKRGRPMKGAISASLWGVS